MPICQLRPWHGWGNEEKAAKRSTGMNEKIVPSRVVTRFAEGHGISIEDMGVAPLVVVSWGRGMTRSLAEAAGAKLCEKWMWHDKYKLYRGEVHGHPVSFGNIPVGAPGTVMVMEEMIACGAKVFIGFGIAGSLQPHAPIGTAIIPTSCISEEGTSRHYLDSVQEITASARLAELLEQSCRKESLVALKGLHWTTDAIYRETEEKVKTYARKGVLGVDMETSAMYALGIFRSVEVCNLLTVSDELWGDWHPPFEAKHLEAAKIAKERAERAILASLKEAAVFPNHSEVAPS